MCYILMPRVEDGWQQHYVFDLSAALCVRTYMRAYGSASGGILQPACHRVL